MAEPTPAPKPSPLHTNSPSETQKAEPASPTPLRCFTGAFIAGGLGYALYLLTRSIAEVFANKPLPTGNYVATNIAVAVRTLVVGMSTLGTAIFGISAVGLIALGIQLLIKQLRQPS